MLLVGNPANTNCLITAKNAPNIPAKNFTALTRLDHDRGLALLGEKLNISTVYISNFAIWGNHSATQYPDISNVKVANKEVSIDEKWYKNTFISD